MLSPTFTPPSHHPVIQEASLLLAMFDHAPDWGPLAPRLNRVIAFTELALSEYVRCLDGCERAKDALMSLIDEMLYDPQSIGGFRRIAHQILSTELCEGWDAEIHHITQVFPSTAFQSTQPLNEWAALVHQARGIQSEFDSLAESLYSSIQCTIARDGGHQMSDVIEGDTRVDLVKREVRSLYELAEACALSKTFTHRVNMRKDVVGCTLICGSARTMIVCLSEIVSASKREGGAYEVASITDMLSKPQHIPGWLELAVHIRLSQTR